MLVKHVFRILMVANMVGLLYLVLYPLPQETKPLYGIYRNQLEKRRWKHAHDFHQHNHSGLNTSYHGNATIRHKGLLAKIRVPKSKQISRPTTPLFNSVSATCVNLSLGTADEGFVNFIRDMRKRRVTHDSEFLRLTDNCTDFKTFRGYHLKPLSNEEANFPIAYGIYVYKSAHQVEQLLRTIYMPQNYYCIHVDAKAPKLLHSALTDVAGCFDNVFVVPDPVLVPYRSIGLLEAEKKCIKLLLQFDSWKYYINLAGQEFPLRTNLEIVRILQLMKDKSDVGSIPSVASYRQDFVHVIENGHLLMTDERRSAIPPHNLILYYGEAHVILSRAFVKFMTENYKALSLLKWLNGTDTPEEHFYSTLNRLPEAPGSFSSHSWSLARAKLWDNTASNGGVRCHGKYIHDICILTTGDLPWLLRQPFIFANKFHVDFDPLALDCLEEIIGYRTLHPLSQNMKIYKEFTAERTIGNCMDMTETYLRSDLLFQLAGCAIEYSYSRFQNIIQSIIEYQI
ncbi:N-acetyllactosaminide beta-1,6-N-acetylglucosaminyl-transferase-like [Glandiceps talaboti]